MVGSTSGYFSKYLSRGMSCRLDSCLQRTKSSQMPHSVASLQAKRSMCSYQIGEHLAGLDTVRGHPVNRMLQLGSGGSVPRVPTYLRVTAEEQHRKRMLYRRNTICLKGPSLRLE